MKKVSNQAKSPTDSLFVRLDVYKERIAADGRTGEVLQYSSINNTPEALAKLMKKLADKGATMHFCYEAGPCGYGVYRQIVAAGHRCDVVAPILIPKPTGDRMKTAGGTPLCLPNFIAPAS